MNSIVQETAGSSTGGYVDYYPGGECSFALNSRERLEVYLGAEPLFSDGVGSGKAVTDWGSRRVVTAMHHANSSGVATGHLGLTAGSRKLSVPRLRKNVGGWNASITVQNAGSNYTDVEVFFFNPDGTLRGSFGPFRLQVGASRVLYNELPNGWTGSAEIFSTDADIAGVVLEAHSPADHVGYEILPYGRITE